MRVLVNYILLAAIRDKLLWGVGLMSIISICLSLFSSSAAIVEQSQFVISYMAGGLRIIFILGLTLFTVFFVRRSFDARDVEFLLTRPISRLTFVISHVLAFTLLSIFAGLFMSIIIGGVSLYYGDTSSVLLWCFGVTIEQIITINVAFFFAMVLSSPVSAGMATFGFYVLSRLMGQLLAIVNQPSVPSDISSFVMKGLSYCMEIISVAIPRFDLLAQTSWLVYGGGQLPDWLFALAQAVTFLLVIATATWIDLRRKQF